MYCFSNKSRYSRYCFLNLVHTEPATSQTEPESVTDTIHTISSYHQSQLSLATGYSNMNRVNQALTFAKTKIYAEKF